MTGALDMVYKIVPQEYFSIKTEGSFEEQAQHLIEQCHPGATGMRLLKLSADSTEAEIPCLQSNRALHGFMHGGCFFTVGDTMTALMCLFFVEKESERMLTVNASIRYLRPIGKDTVQAKARLLRQQGKILDFVCDFFNEAGKRAAQAKYRYALAEPG